MHHIISDGISMGIIINEFAALYNGEELPELRIQYKDYSQWQKKMADKQSIKKQREYWLNNFAGEIPVLNISTDYPRPAVQSFEGGRIDLEIDKEMVQELEALASKTGATMYMLLLAAFNVLLSKYSGQEDIVVGSPVAGRPHADLENIVGVFINTLAMRNYPVGTKSFINFLEEVKANSLKAFENQDYPFEELVENLSIRRDLSRSPIFDTMLSLQNMEMGKIAVNNLEFGQYGFEADI